MKSLTLFLMAVLFWTVTPSARSQELQMPPDADKWQLTIRPEKDKLISDERLVLHTRLEYKGDKPFQGIVTVSIHNTRAVIGFNTAEKLFPLEHTEYGNVIVDAFPNRTGFSYEPGYIKNKPIRLLADLRNIEYLFHDAGEYSIQLKAYMYAGAASPYKSFNILSNKVTFSVSAAPEELEAARELWRGEEQARVMSRTSYGETLRYAEGLRNLKELIRLYPQSPYAQAAKDHLRKIGDPEYNQFLPEDKRLDTKVTLNFPDFVTYKQILESLSLQSGVSLMATEGLEAEKMSSVKTIDLRSEMKIISRYPSATWIRQGDGYLLRPKTAADDNPEYNQFFPEDKRLDAKIDVDFPPKTLLVERFKSFSQQTGVPLHLSPELKDRWRTSIKGTRTLRAEMKSFTGAQQLVWEKQGDGYLLRPKTAAEIAAELADAE